MWSKLSFVFPNHGLSECATDKIFIVHKSFTHQLKKATSLLNVLLILHHEIIPSVKSDVDTPITALALTSILFFLSSPNLWWLGPKSTKPRLNRIFFSGSGCGSGDGTDEKSIGPDSADTVTRFVFLKGQDGEIKAGKRKQSWAAAKRRHNEEASRKTTKAPFHYQDGERRAKSSSDYKVIGFSIVISKSNSSAWTHKSRLEWSDIKIIEL